MRMHKTVQSQRRRCMSARKRRSPAMALIVAASLPCTFPAAAIQQPDAMSGRSWSLSAWGQGAWQMPSGRLATAPSNLPERPLANSVSDLGRSFVLSAGADLDFPERALGLRLGFETTADASATGRIGICEIATGPICTPETVAVTVRGVLAHFRAYRGNPEWSVRPVVGVGLGFRTYSFEQSDCSSRAPGVPRVVCDLIKDMFHDGRSHVVFRGMIGARAERNRYISEATLSAGVGRFSGGTQRVNGAYYADMRLELSAGVQIF